MTISSEKGILRIDLAAYLIFLNMTFQNYVVYFLLTSLKANDPNDSMGNHLSLKWNGIVTNSKDHCGLVDS